MSDPASKSPADSEYYRPRIPRTAWAVVVEQSAKSFRLHGTSKPKIEWLVEAIEEKKAKENELEHLQGSTKELANCT